ncbi:MAG TPA: SDR family NAD(P)-dependent oxidoreductase [Mycobacteriales bacterium]|jgi:NADP-dependent 3-hydroxy acid dehydrogenase YdfG|nr:SDR family NAD(P)-dependent oxidoreductase [Mycobacteriales bacterium]
MTDRPLAGATALVTGASTGIGAATARRLAAEGAVLALVARRRDRLDRLVSSLGGAACAIEADLTTPEHAEGAVQEARDRLGRLDVLVNNAGVMLLGTALHARLAEWDRMVELNVSALLHVTHAAVPYLIDAAATAARGVADIVNVSSTAGRVARPASSVYAFTRHGLTGFTESLRQELLAEHVRVGVVEPGAVDTGQLPGIGPDAARRQVGDIEPLRASDIADAIAYIVTRDRRVAVNEILVRASDQTW